MTGLRYLAGGIAALLLSLVMAAPSGAAVPLRSGEHRTFSRLVFADVAGRTWKVSRPAPDRVVIDFSAGAPELDASTVFDLVPRTRIVEVSTKGLELSLALGCDCPVEVFQIPTGHMVIDVRDGPPLPATPAATATAPADPVRQRNDPDLNLPVVFPLRELAYLQVSTSNPAPAIREPMPKDVVPSGPRQVRLHPSGVVPLIRTLAEDLSKTSDVSACGIEAVARDALLSDPVAAMVSLVERRAELLDGEDRLDVAALRKLSVAYLAAGWGAEAAETAALVPSDDGIVALVAAAIDGEFLPRAVEIDPGCGPATATVALLIRSDPPGWDRNSPADLRQFFDRLDPVTWALLRPRLEERLTDLGEGDLLTGLGSDPTPEPDTIKPRETLAAGTDEAAIRAAIGILARANAAGDPTAERYLVNAMALLPSIPHGDLRHEMEQALASAFVRSRRPSEAVDMVREGLAMAEPLLTLALDRLPASESAEFAVRLGPYLPDGSKVTLRAAALFADFGLASTAQGFADDAGDRFPGEVRADGILLDPWMSRNLQAMSEAEPATWTARNRLATEILDRNATPRPPTDLAAAGATLDRSRAVSDLVASLLAADGSGVTQR